MVKMQVPSPNVFNIRKWVDALRSGKYTQTTNHLHDKVGFCCLGVACDLYAKDTETGWDPIYNGRYSFEGEEAILPPSVRKWLGLSPNPMVQYVDGENHTLASLNDNLKANFHTIADAIEKEYLS